MSTALVAIEVPIQACPRADAPMAAGRRANADFVAHLIATAARAPQTRERRRVEPAEAVAAYGALDRCPGELGRTLSRSL